MENFKLQKYVNEKRIAGLSDKQIATSLGMSLKHLKSLLGEKVPAHIARVGMTVVGSEPKETASEKDKPVDPDKTNSINDFLPEKLKTKDKKESHGWVDTE